MNYKRGCTFALRRSTLDLCLAGQCKILNGSREAKGKILNGSREATGMDAFQNSDPSPFLSRVPISQSPGSSHRYSRLRVTGVLFWR